MGLKTKIITFFMFAEAIAGLWAIVPFIFLIYQQRSNPTNPQYLIDMANLLKDFLIGQIPGMIISGIVHLFFGTKKSRGNL